MFRPGSLTREFSRNRRAGFVSPVRLYIFASFVFFLLLSLLGDFGGAAAGDFEGSAEFGEVTVTVAGSRRTRNPRPPSSRPPSSRPPSSRPHSRRRSASRPSGRRYLPERRTEDRRHSRPAGGQRRKGGPPSPGPGSPPRGGGLDREIRAALGDRHASRSVGHPPPSDREHADRDVLPAAGPRADPRRLPLPEEALLRGAPGLRHPRPDVLRFSSTRSRFCSPNRGRGSPPVWAACWFRTPTSSSPSGATTRTAGYLTVAKSVGVYVLYSLALIPAFVISVFVTG